MLSFSACMPRMFGIVGLVGGGVGGISPVIRTRDSSPAASSFSARDAGSLNKSSPPSRGGGAGDCDGVAARCGSEEGIGGGGGLEALPSCRLGGSSA